MTLTKILPRTPTNLRRLALKAAGIAMVSFVLCPAAAYSQGGIPIWTNRYNAPGNVQDIAYANTVAVDSSNNVIVTGSSDNGTNSDYATIKYSSAGVPLWINRYNGLGNGDYKVFALAVDGSNNVVVTGTGYDVNGSSIEYATIQYSSGGVPLWTNRYDGPGNGGGAAIAVAVDGSNNVIVTGTSDNGANFDYATIKYSRAGVPLWTNRYNGPGNGYDYIHAVVVDGSNNVIVTGEAFVSGSDYDYAVIKYSSAGAPLWTNRYHGPGNGEDFTTALAVDAGNNVFVTGQSTGSGSDYDYATIAYSSAGVPLWTNRYNGPGNGDDNGTSITVDRSGNVFVTGQSFGGNTIDYATIKYSSVSLSPIPLNFQTAGNQMVLSWANAAFGLQSAPAVTGTFTNIPSAASPFTNPISGGQQFFRLQGN